MSTTAVHSGQVTVTVTSAPDGTGAAAADTASSTLSLIYIYSTSTSAQSTGVSSSSSNNNDNASRVSGGVIAGIVVSCIAVLVLMSLALFCYSRKVARKRRAEMASLRSSRHPGPSKAYSHATEGQDTMEERKADPTNQYARSIGGLSSTTGMGTLDGTISRSLMSPSPLPSKPPPAELPTPHNAKHVRMVNVRKPSRPDVAEMYGSYAHPVELQAGSTTNLVSIKSSEKRRGTSSSEGRGSHRHRRGSDVESRGYMSPEPEWHPVGRRGSDGAETDYGTEYGTAADGASIHIYYRSSAATIAQAMSQASFTKPPSTVRSSTMPGTPGLSQTSLADTTR